MRSARARGARVSPRAGSPPRPRRPVACGSGARLRRRRGVLSVVVLASRPPLRLSPLAGCFRSWCAPLVALRRAPPLRAAPRAAAVRWLRGGAPLLPVLVCPAGRPSLRRAPSRGLGSCPPAGPSGGRGRRRPSRPRAFAGPGRPRPRVSASRPPPPCRLGPRASRGARLRPRRSACLASAVRRGRRPRRVRRRSRGGVGCRLARLAASGAARRRRSRRAPACAAVRGAARARLGVSCRPPLRCSSWLVSRVVRARAVGRPRARPPRRAARAGVAPPRRSAPAGAAAAPASALGGAASSPLRWASRRPARPCPPLRGSAVASGAFASARSGLGAPARPGSCFAARVGAGRAVSGAASWVAPRVRARLVSPLVRAAAGFRPPVWRLAVARPALRAAAARPAGARVARVSAARCARRLRPSAPPPAGLSRPASPGARVGLRGRRGRSVGALLLWRCGGGRLLCVPPRLSAASVSLVAARPAVCVPSRPPLSVAAVAWAARLRCSLAGASPRCRPWVGPAPPSAAGLRLRPAVARRSPARARASLSVGPLSLRRRVRRPARSPRRRRPLLRPARVGSRRCSSCAAAPARRGALAALASCVVLLPRALRPVPPWAPSASGVSPSPLRLPRVPAAGCSLRSARPVSPPRRRARLPPRRAVRVRRPCASRARGPRAAAFSRRSVAGRRRSVVSSLPPFSCARCVRRPIDASKRP